MPNTPCLVNSGATAFASGQYSTEDDCTLTQKLFDPEALLFRWDLLPRTRVVHGRRYGHQWQRTCIREYHSVFVLNVDHFARWRVKVPSDYILLDWSPNIGPLASRWELDKFKNCWNKSFRTSKILTLLYQQFSNLFISQRCLSGPR